MSKNKNSRNQRTTNKPKTERANNRHQAHLKDGRLSIDLDLLETPSHQYMADGFGLSHNAGLYQLHFAQLFPSEPNVKRKLQGMVTMCMPFRFLFMFNESLARMDGELRKHMDGAYGSEWPSVRLLNIEELQNVDPQTTRKEKAPLVAVLYGIDVVQLDFFDVEMLNPKRLVQGKVPQVKPILRFFLSTALWFEALKELRTAISKVSDETIQMVKKSIDMVGD